MFLQRLYEKILETYNKRLFAYSYEVRELVNKYERDIANIDISLGYNIVDTGLYFINENPRNINGYKMINEGRNLIIRGLNMQNRYYEASYINEQFTNFINTSIEQYDIFKYN